MIIIKIIRTITTTILENIYNIQTDRQIHTAANNKTLNNLQQLKLVCGVETRVHCRHYSFRVSWLIIRVSHEIIKLLYYINIINIYAITTTTTKGHYRRAKAKFH